MEKDHQEQLKILHIGADPEFLSPVVFENYRVEIETMDNPFSVSQWVRSNGLPDALVCETKLLGGNGFEFYDFWIAQFDRKKSIPFVLLDDEKKPDTAAMALERKIDDVYIKPTDVQTLLRRILMLRQEKPSTDQAAISEMNAFKPFKLNFLKRTFDIVTSSIFLLIASPILLIFAIAIRLETKGDVFYRSKRVGARFKVFDLYKLRSMHTHSDKRLKELAHLSEYKREIPASQTENPDARITKVGQLIRKLNIDELPQLINVWKGDVSMVGNRPLPIYEAELLTTDDWMDRIDSPAGITGRWKVVSRRRLRSLSHDERSRLQNRYSKIANRPNAFWKDIWMIIQTLPAMFKKDNS